MPSSSDLLNELNGLVRLTVVEADTARHRAVQARDQEVRDELIRNARHADIRRVALQRSVTDLGGVPDVLGVAMDRVATAARTQVLDQALPIRQALMADLALEHQLRDRAAFARVIAESLNHADVSATLDKVEAAHVAAIEWIEARLGEVALGVSSALRPTPLQSAAAVGQRVATLPSRAMVAGINRGIAVADQLGGRIGDRLGRTRDAVDVAADALVAGRDTMLRTAEQRSADEGASGVVTALHSARSASGALTARELPIPRFEELTAAQAIAKVDKLDDATEVQAVRDFEEAHKNRSSVLRAADRRTGAIAGEAMS
jgi:hypothetical protein